MATIQWDKKYEVGHERIDFEHQIFVDLIIKIDHANQEGHDKDYLSRLLLELLKYTEFHFTSEENIMYSVGYPDYLHHKDLHNNLLEKFSQRKLAFEMGEEPIQKLVEFLMDWFVHHTVGEDIKIAKYIDAESEV